MDSVKEMIHPVPLPFSFSFLLAASFPVSSSLAVLQQRASEHAAHGSGHVAIATIVTPHLQCDPMKSSVGVSVC